MAELNKVLPLLMPLTFPMRNTKPVKTHANQPKEKHKYTFSMVLYSILE